VIVRETREETKRRGGPAGGRFAFTFGRFAFPFAVRIGANEAQKIEDARGGSGSRGGGVSRAIGGDSESPLAKSRRRRASEDAKQTRGDFRTPLEEGR